MNEENLSFEKKKFEEKLYKAVAYNLRLARGNFRIYTKRGPKCNLELQKRGNVCKSC